jgi:hypothetical protein
MALGLACVVPPVIADWRHRDGRFHRPGTGAWYGWGITLYLLGFALATQVAQIADGLSALRAAEKASVRRLRSAGGRQCPEASGRVGRDAIVDAGCPRSSDGT